MDGALRVDAWASGTSDGFSWDAVLIRSLLNYKDSLPTQSEKQILKIASCLNVCLGPNLAEFFVTIKASNRRGRGNPKNESSCRCACTCRRAERASAG